jgi:hypothetical protein
MLDAIYVTHILPLHVMSSLTRPYNAAIDAVDSLDVRSVEPLERLGLFALPTERTIQVWAGMVPLERPRV